VNEDEILRENQRADVLRETRGSHRGGGRKKERDIGRKKGKKGDGLAREKGT